MLADSESEEEEEREVGDSEDGEREEKEPADSEKQKAAWMAETLFSDPYLTHDEFADPAGFECEDDEEMAGDFE